MAAPRGEPPGTDPEAQDDPRKGDADMAELFKKVLEADPKSTCKDRWEFTLEKSGSDYIIRDLVITGEKGCLGHPKTIAVLARGRRLSDIDVAALSEAGCARDTSCGQTFARLIRELKRASC